MRMRVLPASWSSSSAKHSSSSSSSSESQDQEHPSASSSSTTAAVYLNIYDISPLNHYLYWFGLGIFHSGIEVHGMEYGFGAHEYPTSGVFQVEPKSCPGFIFRRSVCVGTTHMSRSQVHSSIEDLAEDYHGDTYHLIVKNCNHFTDDVCKRLTGTPVPGWVNRLARLGPISSIIINLLLLDDADSLSTTSAFILLESQVPSSIAYCLIASRFQQSEMSMHIRIFLMMTWGPMLRSLREVTMMT